MSAPSLHRESTNSLIRSNSAVFIIAIYTCIVNILLCANVALAIYTCRPLLTIQWKIVVSDS